MSPGTGADCRNRAHRSGQRIRHSLSSPAASLRSRQELSFHGGSAALPTTLTPCAGLTASKALPSPVVLSNRATCGEGWCVESSCGAISLRCLGCATWLLHNPVHSLMQLHERLAGPADWQSVTGFPHHVLTSTMEPTRLGPPLPCPCHLSPKQS